MDKLLALKLFVATVDCRGFSAAARQLGLATSSVTRAVDGLERELGAVLLNRSPRQVTVTEAGTSYYLSARQILEQLAEADAAVSDGGDEPSGPLRVSAPVSFGRHRLSPRLGAWLQQYPRLELDLALTDEIVDLLGERVDVSIRLGVPAPMDGVVARPLGQFRRRVVASPAYLAQRGTPGHPGSWPGMTACASTSAAPGSAGPSTTPPGRACRCRCTAVCAATTPTSCVMRPWPAPAWRCCPTGSPRRSWRTGACASCCPVGRSTRTTRSPR